MVDSDEWGERWGLMEGEGVLLGCHRLYAGLSSVCTLVVSVCACHPCVCLLSVCVLVICVCAHRLCMCSLSCL